MVREFSLGEAIHTMLKRIAESQRKIIAPAQDEQVVELWRALLDMNEVSGQIRSGAISAIGPESVKSPVGWHHGRHHRPPPATITVALGTR
jgi:hypothetical protein